MDPWHRFRLLACLALMVGMLAVSGFALVVWGVPHRPYVFGANSHNVIDPFSVLQAQQTMIDCRSRPGAKEE